MLLRAILSESEEINYAELNAFKKVIAGRIKELPADNATAKTLREIEDLLKHVHAGGKMGIINGELQKINDPTVTAAQKILAQYIFSLEMDPVEREELFTLWRADKLVNTKKLLTKGKHTFDEIIAKYNSNNSIKLFANEMMKISSLGQGKGEFGLSVLSKSINRPKSKGDLLINGRKIEVKTVDGGAARFTDQEVIPAAGYGQASMAVTEFVRARQPEIIVKTGLNLSKICQFGAALDKADQKKYFSLINTLVNLIFGGKNSSSTDVTAVVDAIKQNNQNAAKQAYAVASFNYYMSMKDDEGVLYLDVSASPAICVYYESVDDLTASGLRFNANTAFLTSPTVREIYPQLTIINTTFGANAAAAAEAPPKKGATAKPAAPAGHTPVSTTHSTRRLK